MSGAVFDFDMSGVERLMKRLSKADVEKALDVTATDLAHLGEGVAKETTPQVTGHARRSTAVEKDGRTKLIRGKYPYLNWLDTGKDGRGRVMQTRPGGYQIRRMTRQAVKTAAMKAIGRAVDEIVKGR